MVALSSLGGAGWQFFDDSGNPLSGGKIYTYEAGTTTPAVTYTSNSGLVPNTNPIILDAAGRVANEIWLPTDTLYKMVLKSSADVEIWTKDNITGIPALNTSTAYSVSYSVPYSGALSSNYSVGDRLNQFISVKDFGAIGDGVANDTTAVQAAINSGRSIVFPAGNYLVNNLTGSQNFQRFYASGPVTITKNANGPLFSHSGNYVELNGIQFNGDSAIPTFTGDNVVLTGSNPRLINCGSQWAYGLALKATGNHVQIIGTCAIYQSANAGAAGYDVEIGVSGTATLYHHIYGLYTSQSTGGIKLIDTGSHVIAGGQFGKLWIAAGTKPAGVNGGMTSNCRILGDVLVELSTAMFTGNQFSTQTITFAAGTSQHSLDWSNSTVNATIVNNGNANSTIVRATSLGSTYDVAYGASGPSQKISTITGDIEFPSDIQLNNNKAIRFKDASGSLRLGLTLSSDDDWFIGSNTGANFTNIVSGSGGVYLGPNGTSTVQCTTTFLKPITDNTVSLGVSGQRWSVVYAATGAINTSDARSKQDVENLNDAELRVAIALRKCIRKYRFKDAVKEKGHAARIHVGVIAQDVMKVFASEGLDAFQYGVLCHDTWGSTNAVLDDEGNVISPAREAGEQYGIRYDELMAFILGAL